MNTQKIKEKADALDKARAESKKATAAYLDAKSQGTQKHISVRVGDHIVSVTYMDRETGWNEKVIRGREMIYLGALKVLFQVAEYWRSEVVRCEAELAEEIAG